MTNEEIDFFFKMLKEPCSSTSIDFPLQGQRIDVELHNIGTNRIKFQADISRSFIADKATFQLRHQKTIIVRRVDFGGGHKNPSDKMPNTMFSGFEDYVFKWEDHVHFYMDGYDSRWALPLTKVFDLKILPSDDIYERMVKFFEYCNVENIELQINRHLLI